MSSKFVNNPSFCFITPISYLKEYGTSSNTHLVLAHIVDTNDEYASYYKNRGEHGDLIICDNGAFELGESYSPTELVRLGKKCNANVIVLPDYPGQHQSKTIQAAEKVIDEIQDAGFKTMFAPQAEIGDLEGWIAAYLWAANNPDVDMIGMSILAIPNALPHIPKAYARVVMTQLLESRRIFNHDKHHHYLGLNAGPNIEIPSLILSGHLDTCDSSNPIWCALNGLWYDTETMDCMTQKKSWLPHVNFFIEYNKCEEEHAGIKHNIEITQDIFTNPKDYL